MCRKLTNPGLCIPRFQFRQTEVEYFEPSIIPNHEIVRLQVTVNDPSFMSGTHRIGQRNGNLEEFVERQTWSPKPGEGGFVGINSVSVLPFTNCIV